MFPFLQGMLVYYQHEESVWAEGVVYDQQENFVLLQSGSDKVHFHINVIIICSPSRAFNP